MSALGLVERVAEQLLEHEGDVVHEVDRVVPHDDHPRPDPGSAARRRGWARRPRRGRRASGPGESLAD